MYYAMKSHNWKGEEVRRGPNIFSMISSHQRTLLGGFKTKIGVGVDFLYLFCQPLCLEFTLMRSFRFRNILWSWSLFHFLWLSRKLGSCRKLKLFQFVEFLKIFLSFWTYGRYDKNQCFIFSSIKNWPEK